MESTKSSTFSSSPNVTKQTTLTPKAIIYQKYGIKACYKIQEVQEESPQNGCPGLAIPQKIPTLFRCVLELPEFSVVSPPCKKKKEAEQSAASMALQKLGIDSLQCGHSEPDAAEELVSRLSFIFSNEFQSSLHPLSSHLKAVSYREGELSGSIPVSVLIACDAKLGNLCRSMDARIESNPFLSIRLIMRAAVRLAQLLDISEEDLWIRRKVPYPSVANPVLANQRSDGTNEALTEAVYIPFSFVKDLRSISMNISGCYYLDVIAKALGVDNASMVLMSRNIGKASSESRLYFSALETRNMNFDSEVSQAKESDSDSPFNIRASYLLGQHVYGNAVLASVGYTWRGSDLFKEDVSLRSYFRMLVARMPDGLFKLSRDALLIADLPGLYTTKTNWRGSLPRDLLCAFCRQHRLSEPVFTVVCNSIKSDQNFADSCKRLTDEKSSMGCTSKPGEFNATVSPNKAEVESFSCEIKLFSKNHNLILESSPVDTLMKQGDAVQNASLNVLSFLNLYLKQPNMPLEELSLLGVKCNINCQLTCFLKEFSLCELMHKAQQQSPLLGGHKLNLSNIGPLNSSVSGGDKLLSTQETVCRSLPSNGYIVSISYSVFLVSEGKEIQELLEKSDEFEFEIGTGAVIACLEEGILQMTTGQSVCLYMDMPQTEVILAASKDSEKVMSFLSSKPCCLEYYITVLRVTEPFEDRMEQALFSPPLSKQRVEFALQCIKEFSATSLIDFGCGSGSLLESLVDTPSSLEKIVGIDISQKGLIRAAKVLNTKLEKLEAMTSKIKSAILYEGSITVFDSRLGGYDIGTCLEVIEHMEEDQACLFGDIALGLFRPRVLIVSTPNYEYNVILQRSNPASQVEDPNDKPQPQSCKFRNHDHKFEWTREQFNHWAASLALKYNYSVEFDGVGGIQGVEPGFASQIAVFRRNHQEFVKDFGSLINMENQYETLWKWDATTTVS